jgi:hypothetical protein
MLVHLFNTKKTIAKKLKNAISNYNALFENEISRREKWFKRTRTLKFLVETLEASATLLESELIDALDSCTNHEIDIEFAKRTYNEKYYNIKNSIRAINDDPVILFDAEFEKQKGKFDK